MQLFGCIGQADNNRLEGMPWKILFTKSNRIIFGRNRLTCTERSTAKARISFCVGIVRGSHWKENGTLEQITTQLESCSISYFVQGGIRPNPKLSEVEQIVRNVKGDIVDVILHLGAGLL